MLVVLQKYMTAKNPTKGMLNKSFMFTWLTDNLNPTDRTIYSETTIFFLQAASTA